MSIRARVTRSTLLLLVIAAACRTAPPATKDTDDSTEHVVDTDVAETDAEDSTTDPIVDTSLPTVHTDTATQTPEGVPVSALSPGDLVITELMITPSGCGSVFTGQFIEIKNATDQVVDLRGLTVTTGRRSRTVPTHLLVDAGAYVIARPDITSTCPAYPALAWDFEYNQLMTLTTYSGPIKLYAGSVTLDEVDHQTWELIDGASFHLAPSREDATANDAADSWCSADEALGASNFGTPGRAAVTCTPPAP